MKSFLINKLRIGETDLFQCKAVNQTTEHLLQGCTLHTNLRSNCWRETTPLATKLCGDLDDLR